MKQKKWSWGEEVKANKKQELDDRVNSLSYLEVFTEDQTEPQSSVSSGNKFIEYYFARYFSSTLNVLSHQLWMQFVCVSHQDIQLLSLLFITKELSVKGLCNLPQLT